jgi:hypothetical protein
MNVHTLVNLGTAFVLCFVMTSNELRVADEGHHRDTSVTSKHA